MSRSKYKNVEEWRRQIRDWVFEMEDVVDTYVVMAAAQKARTSSQKILHIIDYTAKLRTIAIEIQSIKNKLNDKMKMFSNELLQVTYQQTHHHHVAAQSPP
uniref:Putative Disease resistance protein n=1 Tax=Davidia involucrata TaxID=16924 RepID=A0A5B7C1K2_DAVIN